MKSTEAKKIQSTFDATFDATLAKIDAGHMSGIDKKSYTRPVLTRYGKVSRLTAAVTGSNTDTFGGNEVG